MSDARMLAAAIVDSTPGPNLRLRQGAIVSVAADGTATVTIGGSTTQVAGVKVASRCCPIPGATCWLATDGRDLFVLDTLAPAGPAFCALSRVTTSQSIQDTAYTAIQFNSEIKDTAGMWSSSANTKVYAKVPGIYSITGSIMWANSTTGSRTARLLKSGTSALAFDKTEAFNGSHTNTVSCVAALVLNDYIEIEALQNTGGAVNVLADPTTSLRMCWLGPCV